MCFAVESVDLKETAALASRYAEMQKDFAAWIASVTRSMDVESHCGDPENPPSPPPGPAPAPSTNCTFTAATGCFGGDRQKRQASSKEECCAFCQADPVCTVAVFEEKTRACHIKEESKPGCNKEGYIACRARPR